MSSEGNRRLALIVACDRYADPDLKQLQAPSQDTERFARILEDPTIGEFKVTRLINEPYHTVREKIDEFVQSCNREDTILLYLSCHGIKDKNGQLYFATITTNRKRLFSTGIESNFVNNMLDQCRAQQKVVLLDCCYSGAFEKGRYVRADKQVNATEYFGRGSVVITAADAMQYAFEEGDDKIENLGKGGSYFTNALIEGLETGKADVNKDGSITYHELYNYIHDHVRRITPDQTPTLNTRVEGDFVVFKNIGGNLGSSEAEAYAVRRPDNPLSHQQIDPFSQYIQEAHTLLEEERYEEAIKIFDSILTLMRSEQEEGRLEALNGKGMAFYKKKMYKEALGCFNEALTIKPKNLEARNYVEIINEKISKERKGKTKGYGKDIKQDTTALEKHTEKKVIDALHKSTERNRSRKGNKPSKRSEPTIKLPISGSSSTLAKVRSKLIKLGDPRNPHNDPTLPYYIPNLDKNTDSNQSIQKPNTPYPNDARAWNEKGYSLNNLGRYEEAIKCFDKALELDPNDARAWNEKGYSLAMLRRPLEAIACYDKALQIDPNYADAWNVKGLSLHILGRYEEAIKCFDKALQIDPNNASIWEYKGLSLNNLGRYEEAIKCFDKALQIDPNNAVAWNKKGSSLLDQKKYGEAIKSYDKSLKIDPNYAVAWSNNGTALAALDRYEEAIKCFDKALEPDQNDPFTWNGKGYSLNNLGRYEEAIKCFDKALELDPNDAVAWYNKGYSLNKMGKKKDAKRYLKKAKELDHEV